MNKTVLVFWFRRIFRPGFPLGLYHKVREMVLLPYVHYLLRKAWKQRGAAFTVVQIGANDGVHSDPISTSVKRFQWSGVLVEPNPENFALLQDTYRDQPQIKLEQAAISDHDGTVTLYRPIPLPDGRPNPMKGKDTLQRERYESVAWIAPDWESLIEPITVASLTFASLCRKHALSELDYLLVDTEGHDKVILDQIDFQTVRPRFIQFEYSHLSREESEELYARLRAAGYRLLPLRWDIFCYLPGNVS